MAICERCGKEHEELCEVNVPGGKTEMWCGDCLDDAFECDCCHEWFSMEYNHTEVDGDESTLVCDNCRDTFYYQCDDCGGWFSCLNDTSTGSVCDDCFSEYIQCYDCSEWIPSSDATYVECIDAYVCERCLDDYFTICDCCGEYVRSEDTYSRNGYSYCESCYSDMSHVIRDYHDSPEVHFNGGCDPDGFFRGFGIELEIDGGDAAEDCANELAEFLGDDYEDEMYFMHDGSLHNGFEIITQPHTDEVRSMDKESGTLETGHRVGGRKQTKKRKLCIFIV